MPTLYTCLRAGALALLPLVATAQTPAPLLEVKTTDAAPATRLQLQTTGGLYLGGDYDGDAFGANIPLEGAGTRLIWYPGKGAFRAGGIDGTQWDAANIGNYSTAAGFNCRTLGDYATAFGKDVTAAQFGSFAVGEYGIASGATSVALGYDAHTNARQGSFVFADRSVAHDNSGANNNAFRAGVNHSANWRVSGGFRVFTSSNLTTGVTFQSGAVTSNWGQSNAVISTSTGAYLSTSGVWTNTSDRRKKHRFEAVAGEDVLRRLRHVPITRWSYKKDTGPVRHLGPMAQDFYRAFQLGPDSISIGTVDADGVALAGVQALDARTRALQTENAQLRARLDALERVTNAPSTATFPLNTTLLFASAALLALLLLRRR
jgi:Chaperone of endosialidase